VACLLVFDDLFASYCARVMEFVFVRSLLFNVLFVYDMY